MYILDLKESSNIKLASYDPRQLTLIVSFHSGSTYRYNDVPFEVIEQWQKAKSVGSFFYYNIRTKFSYRRIS